MLSLSNNYSMRMFIENTSYRSLLKQKEQKAYIYFLLIEREGGSVRLNASNNVILR